MAAAFLLFAQGAFAVEPVEEIVEQKYPSDGAVTLTIRNTDGSVRIYGGDIAEISIQAIKKAYTSARLKEIVVDIKATRNSVAIETISPPRKTGFSLRDRSGTVDYIITVPQTTKITQLELMNGEVLVEGLRGGSATAHLVNGWLCGHNCFADLNFSIANGRIDLAYDWWDSQKFSVKSSSQNASIRAILPSDASATIAAQAPTGWIANGFEAKKSAPAEPPHALNFTLGTEPEAAFEMKAANGNIRIDKMY
ncbi:MAG TPA: hypothetical protein VN921_03670 [Chthoniobacterales bacterium]|nr:hypothetical protein [Chthoniobacterales bacterium]